MPSTLPGARLRRLLALWVDEVTFGEVIEPTMADFQHEMLTAGTPRHRFMTRLASYAAVVRVLVTCGLEGPVMGVRVAALLTLGAGGAVLANWARTAGMDGRVGNSAILLPIFVAAIAFRTIDRGRSYWRVFLPSLVVGATACVGLDLAVSLTGPTPFVWHLTWLLVGGSLVIVSSALGAAAAWSPLDVAAPLPRRAMTGLVCAGATTTVGFFVRNFFRAENLSATDALRIPFYIVLFGVILAATSLPVLLVARTWIARRTSLVIVATLGFPIPIVAASVIDGRSLAQAVVDCLHLTLPLLLSSLPFITGAAALGWIIGVRRIDSRGQA